MEKVAAQPNYNAQYPQQYQQPQWVRGTYTGGRPLIRRMRRGFPPAGYSQRSYGSPRAVNVSIGYGHAPYGYNQQQQRQQQRPAPRPSPSASQEAINSQVSNMKAQKAGLNTNLATSNVTKYRSGYPVPGPSAPAPVDPRVAHVRSMQESLNSYSSKRNSQPAPAPAVNPAAAAPAPAPASQPVAGKASTVPREPVSMVDVLRNNRMGLKARFKGHATSDYNIPKSNYKLSPTAGKITLKNSLSHANKRLNILNNQLVLRPKSPELIYRRNIVKKRLAELGAIQRSKGLNVMSDIEVGKGPSKKDLAKEQARKNIAKLKGQKYSPAAREKALKRLSINKLMADDKARGGENAKIDRKGLEEYKAYQRSRMSPDQKSNKDYIANKMKVPYYKLDSKTKAIKKNLAIRQKALKSARTAKDLVDLPAKQNLPAIGADMRKKIVDNTRDYVNSKQYVRAN